MTGCSTTVVSDGGQKMIGTKNPSLSADETRFIFQAHCYAPQKSNGSLPKIDSNHYDEAHFWLNGYVNKQNGRIWSEANPQMYAETPLHPEKLTVWCALWAGGILLQKR
ncbi:hypothetical protein TNCV_534661 [Trichonephila clavipes]|nr:hypothetical protein TNCV_534661 [Trichonephila clavipes]